jgi:hypothetical protein
MSKSAPKFGAFRIDPEDVKAFAQGEGIPSKTGPAEPPVESIPDEVITELVDDIDVDTATAYVELSHTSAAQPAEHTSRRSQRLAAPTPFSKMKRVSLDLPEYVVDQLRERALKQKTTVRNVLMKAIRSNGIRIQDDDMIEDGRKPRKSKL